MQNIVFLHGSNMTGTSFNYIREHLPRHNLYLPEYSTSTGLEKNIDQVIEKIDEEMGKKSFTVIGHSMGGLIALGVARRMEKCTKMISMSTPFGGSKLANLLSLAMPFHQMFRDIRTTDSFLNELMEDPAPVPATCLISTQGNSPFNFRENDGVVAIDSQKELKGAQIIELLLNHYEILLSNLTIKEIKKAL
jgi:pimeloyl-ACP methyl ester carboxylesterase